MSEPIDVIAPSDLPGGYELHINVGSEPMVVTIPMDGVKEGQSFSAVPRPASATTATPLLGGAGDIPTGRFRDGFCDCCQYFCHAVFWCAMCCTPCALGQVMTRMGLDWKADPKPDPRSGTSAFCIILVLYIVWDLAVGLISPRSYTLDEEDIDVAEEEAVATSPRSIIASILNWVFIIFMLVIFTKTRGYIRSQYNIEGSCFGDCCAAFWCSCCTVIQMASHTADPKVTKSKCCTETGLEAGVNIV